MGVNTVTMRRRRRRNVPSDRSELFPVRLSRAEQLYLRNSGLAPTVFLDDLEKALEAPGESVTVRVTRAMAESIRDGLTKALAQSGFDRSYELNPRGRLLEELIDRFFLP